MSTENKSITFDKEARDNLPDSVREQMNKDRNEASKTQSKGLNIDSVVPCWCLECDWSGDTTELINEVIIGFDKERIEIPACPECGYDIKVQE